MKLSTRSIVITGMLGAIAIALGSSGLGFIPVPTPVGKATILHIPAILAGIIEGPVVGGLVGLIFGLYSFLQATSPMASDPLVAIPARILIGVISYYVYYIFKKNIVLASALAAIAGTLTNTIGFLGMSVVRGYLKWPAVWAIVISHSIFEMVIAVVIIAAVVRALHRYLQQA